MRDVRVHAITDGRDVSPHQAAGLLAELEREWEGTPVGIRTVGGRYYAMDRDGRWDRTQRYYATVVDGLGGPAAERARGGRGVATRPASPTSSSSRSRSATTRGDTIGRGDELIFFNFRPDRARQVCRALADHSFDGFDRGTQPPLPHLTTMTAYWDGQPGAVAFGEVRPKDVLADVAGARRERRSCTPPRPRSTRT